MKNWDGAWSCYITSKCQPMTQVTSKTSWGLPKVHLRTYNRSLGGLVVKWECAERVKVTQNGQKYCFFWSKNGCLWEKFMAQELSKISKGLWLCRLKCAQNQQSLLLYTIQNKGTKKRLMILHCAYTFVQNQHFLKESSER